MREIKLIITAVLLISASARAQTSSSEADYDFRTRTSVGADWKIAKGLHIDGGYELRLSDRSSRVERNQLNVGISYSPVKHLDIGAGYYYIGHYDSGKILKPRHRFYVDIAGAYKFGAWKLSLRERIQLTHKSYDFNRFQQSPNPIELKSRVKLSYKKFIHLEPYAYAELRNCFNAPSFTADYNEATGKYSNYKFIDYSDVYVNRIRGVLGLEWKITSAHSVDMRFMTDWCRDKVIDTNAEGTKLKSYTWEKSLVNSLSIGYVFSF